MNISIPDANFNNPAAGATLSPAIMHLPFANEFCIFNDVGEPMAKLDLVLMIVFGSTTVLGLLCAVLCFRKSLRVANEKDGDLKMFFWSIGTMFGLIVAGASAGYILLPMILHR